MSEVRIMKRVRVVNLGEKFDKQVFVLPPNSPLPYDETLTVVGPFDDCDWRVFLWADEPSTFRGLISP